jgi:hypothetical protein
MLQRIWDRIGQASPKAQDYMTRFQPWLDAAMPASTVESPTTRVR